MNDVQREAARALVACGHRLHRRHERCGQWTKLDDAHHRPGPCRVCACVCDEPIPDGAEPPEYDDEPPADDWWPADQVETEQDENEGRLF